MIGKKRKAALLSAAICCMILSARARKPEVESRTWNFDDRTYQGSAVLIDEMRAVVDVGGGRLQSMMRIRLSADDIAYIDSVGAMKTLPDASPAPDEPDPLLLSTGAQAAQSIDIRADLNGSTSIPVASRDWWRIAKSDPDLGELNRPGHNAAEFTIYKSADGAWQLIACIRKTAYADSREGRILYRWQADVLTDEHWQPQGLVACPESDDKDYATVQGPFCLHHQDTWYLYFSTEKGVFCIPSTDGIHFDHADGIHMCRLQWIYKTQEEIDRWRGCYYHDHPKASYFISNSGAMIHKMSRLKKAGDEEGYQKAKAKLDNNMRLRETEGARYWDLFS